MLFIVPDSWKPECFKSAGGKWRQFKSKLTTKFVYDRMETLDLNTPPAGYPTIEPSDWSEFVIKRLSKPFKVT